MRALVPTWSPTIYEEARFTTQTFYIGSTWVHGAVIYGYAHRAATNEVRNTTDELLDQAVERILRTMSGKRFLMGDWNQEIGQLRTFDILKQHGWVEIQQWAHETYGRPIDKTCQATSTKDFVWVSPELVPHLRKVHTCNLFKDHLVLWAELADISPDEPVHLWREPIPFQWSNVQDQLESKEWQCDPNLEPQAGLEAIASEFEDRLHTTMRQQGQNLLDFHRGRSKTKEVHKVLPTAAPMKPSCHGHVQPDYHGQTRKHTQWFKQLRRLESISRTHSESEQAKRHKQREWQAILRAAGFPTSFQKWWKTTPNKLDRAPSKLPDLVPTRDELVSIQATFDREFRLLEQALLSTCKATARKIRHDNPQKIFQDIKVPLAQPIALLDTSVSATILAVDAHEQALEFAPSGFAPDRPIYSANAVADVIHLEADKLWIANMGDFQPGDTLRQDQHVGSLTELFTLFGNEWEKRWDRHLHVPPTEWDPMVDFFIQNFPAGEAMHLPEITPDQWYLTLRRKKKRAAVGPDGWAREDLLRMPVDLVKNLLNILHDIEQGRDWPITAVTGLICSLAKVPHASTVNQYRPITVFSLIYRTWSSLRAKATLRHLEKYAPSKCFGNLPLRTASQVWLGIQSELETANTFDDRASGVMIDIQKCFNHLPRIPILAVCHHLGVDVAILKAWANALQRMTRRFSIRGSVGPGLRSTTGCAEGCALSVVGMLAINVLIDCWLSVKVPAATLWSYVDNWELTAPSVATTLEGIQNLRRAAQGLDLLIDEDKTIVWANNPQERKTLRDSQHHVVASARDLGGHVQYTQQTTNSTITSRIQKFKPRWRDFARSPAPRKQKLVAIKMAAWPNVLHGIASVHICDDLLDELRAAAMRSIGLNGMGASSLAQFSLVENPSVDPGFYALTKTVMDCRSYLSSEVCIPILNVIAIPKQKSRPSVGPCSVLLHRLHGIGWSWDSNHFVDHQGYPIDVWNCPIQELKQRLQQAWQSRAQHLLADRKTFGGMHLMSPTLTMRASPSDPGDKGILHTALNGTFFTADHAHHLDPTATNQCPFCGAADSQTHRHWECVPLEPARRSSPDMRRFILQCPPATYNHGWIPEPASQRDFVRELLHIPDHTRWFQLPACPPPVLDFFTDGSCLEPGDSQCRLSSWGVVVYDPQGNQEFQKISNGLLPGRLQTITRAELTAVISALACILVAPRQFRLWIDNDQVFKTVSKIMGYQQLYRFNNKVPNHDLLNEVGALAFQVKHLCLATVKVCSHQQEDESASWVDNWSFRGNAAADRAAEQAYANFPHVMQVWERCRQEIRELEHMRAALHADLIAVGRMAQKLQADQKQREATSEATSDLPCRVSAFQPWKFDATGDEIAACQCDDLRTLATWMEDVHSEEHPVRFWTWQQMLVDLRLQYPGFGPWYRPHPVSIWEPGNTCTNTDFHKRNRWFRTWFTKLAQLAGAPLPTRHLRADSHVFLYWTPCLPVRVSQTRWEAVERWLMQWTSAFRQHKDTRQIRSLP
eukprot:Skav217538  [mRNA]  locus=scaffold467:222594:227126:+ [translate_table: standard]